MQNDWRMNSKNMETSILQIDDNKDSERNNLVIDDNRNFLNCIKATVKIKFLIDSMYRIIQQMRMTTGESIQMECMPLV